MKKNSKLNDFAKNCLHYKRRRRRRRRRRRKTNKKTEEEEEQKQQQQQQTLYTPSCSLVTSALCYRLTNVFDAEGVGLRLLALVIPIAYIPCVFPPLVVQDLDNTLLLQLQDGQRDLVSPWRPCKIECVLWQNGPWKLLLIMPEVRETFTLYS